MNDYISRQALLRDIEKYHLSDGKFQHWVEVQPSVEAEPVRHGRWIDETFKPTGLVFHPYVCDQCGCHSESNFTYCPDCGARMDGEQDG